MILNYEVNVCVCLNPSLPLDVFIGAQQRKFNLPYLSRTPF